MSYGQTRPLYGMGSPSRTPCSRTTDTCLSVETGFGGFAYSAEFRSAARSDWIEAPNQEDRYLEGQVNATHFFVAVDVGTPRELPYYG